MPPVVIPYDINNLERAVHKTGFGIYHKFIAILTAASSFSEAVVLTTLFLAIPLMGCDIQLTENMMVSVSVVYSIGEAVGSFIFLSLSDIYGKRSLIPILSAVIFASTLACGFVHGYLFLSFFAMFLGSSLSVNTTVMRINLLENVSMTRRGIILTLLDLAWSLGYIFAIALTWLCYPLALKFYLNDSRYFTWRVLLAVSSIFSVMLGCMSNLIKPSFRYLLYCKKTREALIVLKEMYAVNNSKNSEEFDIKENAIAGNISDFGIYRNMQMRIYMEHACSLIRTICRGLAVLSGRRFFIRMLIVMYLKTVTLSGMFITHLWMYKVVNQTSSCFLYKTDILLLEHPPDTACDLKFDYIVFRDFSLLIPNIIIGQLFAIFLIDRVERKFLIAVACATCAVTNIALAFLDQRLVIAKIGLASVYLMFYSCMESVMNVAIIEMFPTALRGTAIGSAQFFSKLMAVFVKRYLAMPCNVSLFLAGTSMAVGVIFAFFLPELKGKPLTE